MKKLLIFTMALGFIFSFTEESNAKKKKPTVAESNKKVLKGTKIKVYGPKEVSKTFEIPLDKIKVPPIPWTKKELKKAAKLGRVLVLRACPKEYPNTMKTMRTQHRSMLSIGEKLLSIDENTSACVLRKGWIIADFLPYRWTTKCEFEVYNRITYEKTVYIRPCLYGGQLTEAIKRGSYSKLLPETLYDALLMYQDYKKTLKKSLKDHLFMSKTASSAPCTLTFKIKNKKRVEKTMCDTSMVVDIKKGIIMFGRLNPTWRHPDLYMLTQSTKN